MAEAKVEMFTNGMHVSREDAGSYSITSILTFPGAAKPLEPGLLTMLMKNDGYNVADARGPSFNPAQTRELNQNDIVQSNSVPLNVETLSRTI